MKKQLTTFLALTIGCFLLNVVYAQDGHFDPKGKAPSKSTIQKWEELKNSMPFEDKQDFEEQKKGFIAAPDYKEIMADAGHVAWSMGKVCLFARRQGLPEYSSVIAAPGSFEYELWLIRSYSRNLPGSGI